MSTNTPNKICTNPEPMRPATLEGAIKTIESLERRVEQLEAVIGSRYIEEEDR